MGKLSVVTGDMIKYSHSSHIRVLPKLVTMIRHNERKGISLQHLPKTFTSIHMFKIILSARMLTYTLRCYSRGSDLTDNLTESSSESQIKNNMLSEGPTYVLRSNIDGRKTKNLNFKFRCLGYKLFEHLVRSKTGFITVCYCLVTPVPHPPLNSHLHSIRYLVPYVFPESREPCSFSSKHLVSYAFERQEYTLEQPTPSCIPAASNNHDQGGNFLPMNLFLAPRCCP